MNCELKIKNIIFLIDEEDYLKIKKYKWTLLITKGKYYARTDIFMHREILNLKNGGGKVVDHIDRNGLNNMKSNLRICSKKQNSYNSRRNKKAFSIYKGVGKKKRYRGWRSLIHFEGKSYELGFYETEKEAAIAYDTKAKELFGEYAFLNFPKKSNKYKYKNSKKIFFKKGGYTLVDKEDFNNLSRYNWRLFESNNHKYAITCLLLHRFIMGKNIPLNMCVDHINRNTLDNRKSNLRIIGFPDNGRNKEKFKGNYTSRYKGVSLYRPQRKWIAYVSYKGKTRYIGLFNEEIEAALAYNNYVKKIFGSFAVLNKI
jgi:hypothetical protein